MADEKHNGPEENKEESGLPPLSDFDSGGDSAGGLPPQEDQESDEGISGLPPLGDIDTEDPVPTGGARKAPLPGYEGSGQQDTPAPEQDEGTGFQDLSADSDFSPETPASGGQGSDFETPAFDSAFGQSDEGQDTFGGADTPTQAMETPMFGQQGGGQQQQQEEGGFGFDQDAFGGFDGGTPAPDFSADTGAPTQPATPPPAPPMPEPASSGGGGLVLAIILLIVGLAIGIFAGPFATHSWYSFEAVNPWAADVSEAEEQISQLESDVSNLRRTIREYEEAMGTDPNSTVALNPEQLAELAQKIKEANQELTRVNEDLAVAREDLSVTERELAEKKEEFLQAENDYQNLLNQTAIWQARRDGLLSETERLEEEVGELEQADQRRIATKDALEHAVDRLAIDVRESIPLTPPKYSYEGRVDAVERLESRVQAAKWVTPELMEEYTELYLAELAISKSRDYFFAQVPVVDRFGVKRMKWAECVMNGNWSVYYRTIDGGATGVYDNVKLTGSPRYEFRQDLDAEHIAMIADIIESNRTPDFAEKLAVLAESQVLAEGKPEYQRVYDSL